jgi:hypothetical protein
LRFAPLLLAACSAASAGGAPERASRSQEAVTGPFVWKGYTWKPTSGGMAGVCKGDPGNVSVDANGYLHLRLTNTAGAWAASEVFTTTSLGFGTYQWQIDGPIDRMDHTVVLGLFPYGPAAGIGADGTNEIDTEFSFWNDEVANNNADFGVYPATAAGMHGELVYPFSLGGGNAATARMVWSSQGVHAALLAGFQPIGTTANVLQTWDYTPTDTADNIPQHAMPLGMNLWCYKAVPASGQSVEIVLRDFLFVPEGQPLPDGGAPQDDGGAPEAGASGDDAAADAGAGGAPDASGASDASGAADAGAKAGHDGAASGQPDAGSGSSASPAGGATGDSGGCGVAPGRSRPWGEAGVLAAIGALGLRRRRRSHAQRAS